MQKFVPLSLPLEELSLQGYSVSHVAACWETSYVVLEHDTLGDVLLSMGTDDFGDLGIGGCGKDDTRRVHRVEFSAECLGADVPVRGWHLGAKGTMDPAGCGRDSCAGS